MYSKSAQSKLMAALLYFGKEESEFHQAVESGLALKQHSELDKHSSVLIALLKKCIKELREPTGGGSVSTSDGYRALSDVAFSIQALCEETHIVQKPLPKKARRL